MTSLGRAVGPLILAFAVSATGAAASARVPELGNGDLIPPGLRPVAIDSPALQQSLSRGPAWRGFATQHRGWRALWNQATGTPHRAFGPGIPLPGFAPRPAAADRAVRAFIAGHPELFGTGPTLETLAAHPIEDRWYVRYRQTVGGVPVLFADWEFRLSADGRLFMFGADAYPTGAQVPAGPRLVAAAARTAATQGLPFDPARDQLSGEQLYLVPWRAAGRTRLRPAYQVQVRTQAPLGSWLALVDATDDYIGNSPEGSQYLHDICAAMIGMDRYAVSQLASQVPTMLALVRAGLGCALIPRSIMAMRVEGVRYRELDPADAHSVTLHACWSPDSPNPALQRLAESLRENPHLDA